MQRKENFWQIIIFALIIATVMMLFPRSPKVVAEFTPDHSMAVLRHE